MTADADDHTRSTNTTILRFNSIRFSLIFARDGRVLHLVAEIGIGWKRFYQILPTRRSRAV